MADQHSNSDGTTSSDVLDRIHALIQENYHGDSMETMRDPIATLLKAQEEIESLRARLVEIAFERDQWSLRHAVLNADYSTLAEQIAPKHEHLWILKDPAYNDRDDRCSICGEIRPEGTCTDFGRDHHWIPATIDGWSGQWCTRCASRS